MLETEQSLVNCMNEVALNQVRAGVDEFNNQQRRVSVRLKICCFNSIRLFQPSNFGYEIQKDRLGFKTPGNHNPKREF
ncbi:MAG: hypothetical protein AAF623_12200 [Planctomycetota bacterium]